jgi:Tol biopolymer transport system component
MSLSPDFQSILDVSNHRTLWLTPVEPGEAVQIFEMPSADLRLDYPAWSFDGEWVAFDRVQPSGGDIWMLSESEQ